MMIRALFDRLFRRPLVLVEVVVLSLVIAVLSFAQPVFAIQVLNRYVAFGVDATLATLCLGTLLALMFEVGFRRARLGLIAAAGAPRDRILAERVYDVLVGADLRALSTLPTSERRQIGQAVDTVRQAFQPVTLATALDLPFALIFVIGIALLNPTLGAVAGAGVLAGLILIAVSAASLRRSQAALSDAGGLRTGLINAATLSPDTVRAFNGRDRLARLWSKADARFRAVHTRLSMSHGVSQVLGQTLVAVVGVAVIAVGAMEVVAQRLDIGAMIGANILAARALQPVLRLTTAAESVAKARHALAGLARFQTLDRERSGGTTLPAYKGRLTLEDVAFAWPGAASPLFERMTLDLQPGTVLVVTGGNGAGKTTLARLLNGLLTPDRGAIRADGTDVRQLDPAWWHTQVIYLPQEPVFLPGTWRDSITALKPDLEEAVLNRLLESAGLRGIVADLPKGLDTPVRDGGTDLALGIRRRLALARALASDGRIAVLDEPLEAMDADGRRVMTDVVRALSAFGRTIVILSHDPSMVAGPHMVLDLDEKPVPAIRTVRSEAPPAPSAAAASRKPAGRTGRDS